MTVKSFLLFLLKQPKYQFSMDFSVKLESFPEEVRGEKKMVPVLVYCIYPSLRITDGEELLWGKRWGWKEGGEEGAGQHW